MFEHPVIGPPGYGNHVASGHHSSSSMSSTSTVAGLTSKVIDENVPTDFVKKEFPEVTLHHSTTSSPASIAPTALGNVQVNTQVLAAVLQAGPGSSIAASTFFNLSHSTTGIATNQITKTTSATFAKPPKHYLSPSSSTQPQKLRKVYITQHDHSVVSHTVPEYDLTQWKALTDHWHSHQHPHSPAVPSALNSHPVALKIRQAAKQRLPAGTPSPHGLRPRSSLSSSPILVWVLKKGYRVKKAKREAEVKRRLEAMRIVQLEGWVPELQPQPAKISSRGNSRTPTPAGGISKRHRSRAPSPSVGRARYARLKRLLTPPPPPPPHSTNENENTDTPAVDLDSSQAQLTLGSFPGESLPSDQEEEETEVWEAVRRMVGLGKNKVKNATLPDAIASESDKTTSASASGQGQSQSVWQPPPYSFAGLASRDVRVGRRGFWSTRSSTSSNPTSTTPPTSPVRLEVRKRARSVTAPLHVDLEVSIKTHDSEEGREHRNVHGRAEEDNGNEVPSGTRDDEDRMDVDDLAVVVVVHPSSDLQAAAVKGQHRDASPMDVDTEEEVHSQENKENNGAYLQYATSAPAISFAEFGNATLESPLRLPAIFNTNTNSNSPHDAARGGFSLQDQPGVEAVPRRQQLPTPPPVAFLSNLDAERVEPVRELEVEDDDASTTVAVPSDAAQYSDHGEMDNDIEVDELTDEDDAPLPQVMKKLVPAYREKPHKSNANTNINEAPKQVNDEDDAPLPQGMQKLVPAYRKKARKPRAENENVNEHDGETPKDDAPGQYTDDSDEPTSFLDASHHAAPARAPPPSPPRISTNDVHAPSAPYVPNKPPLQSPTSPTARRVPQALFIPTRPPQRSSPFRKAKHKLDRADAAHESRDLIKRPPPPPPPPTNKRTTLSLQHANKRHGVTHPKTPKTTTRTAPPGDTLACKSIRGWRDSLEKLKNMFLTRADSEQVSRIDEKRVLGDVRDTLDDMEISKNIASIRIVREEMADTFGALQRLLSKPRIWKANDESFVQEAKVLLERSVQLGKVFEARWRDEVKVQQSAAARGVVVV